MTPSSMGTEMISSVKFSTSSTLTSAPLMVASRPIVERTSSPTIAATNIPLLRINLSRYAERNTLQESLHHVVPHLCCFNHKSTSKYCRKIFSTRNSFAQHSNVRSSLSFRLAYTFNAFWKVCISICMTERCLHRNQTNLMQLRLDRKDL